MIKLLSDADRKLGRLDGVAQILPNPALFVAMYVKAVGISCEIPLWRNIFEFAPHKEALVSSQIEGTQTSLVDVLNTEDDDINKPVAKAQTTCALCRMG